MTKYFDGAVLISLCVGISLFMANSYHFAYLVRLGIEPILVQSSFSLSHYLSNLSSAIASISVVNNLIISMFFIFMVPVLVRNVAIFRLSWMRIKRRTNREIRAARSKKTILMLSKASIIYVLAGLVLLFLVYLFGHIVDAARFDADRFLSGVKDKKYGNKSVILEESSEIVYLVECGEELCAGLSSKDMSVVYMLSSLDKVVARSSLEDRGRSGIARR